MEAYFEEEEDSKRRRRILEEPSRARKTETSHPSGNRRVSFDGKSVKSHDWIIPSWQRQRQRHQCAGTWLVVENTKEKRSKWSRGRKRQGGWVGGWLVGLTPGVESKTRENKIHTRPLARLRFVHFIRANWIYLCGRLPHPWWGGRGGEGGWNVAQPVKQFRFFSTPTTPFRCPEPAAFIVYLIPRCLSTSRSKVLVAARYFNGAERYEGLEMAGDLRREEFYCHDPNSNFDMDCFRYFLKLSR